MKLFAISDLHLSLFKSKEMDVFGKHWKNHWGQITKDWNERVSDEDVVLICGDISWAMRLDDAICDLEFTIIGIRLLLRRAPCSATKLILFRIMQSGWEIMFLRVRADGSSGKTVSQTKIKRFIPEKYPG